MHKNQRSPHLGQELHYKFTEPAVYQWDSSESGIHWLIGIDL